MASIPTMQAARCSQTAKGSVPKIVPTLLRHCERLQTSSRRSVAYAKNERGPTRSSSPIGKSVSKTVSSKSQGKTVSSRTTSTNATTDKDSAAKTPYVPKATPKPEQDSLKDSAFLLLSRFDWALLFGDAWIVATVFGTSGLLPSVDASPISYAAAATWAVTATCRGDYTGSSSSDEETAWLQGWTVYTGVLSACFTWLFSTPVLLLAYALLVSHGMLDAGPVMEVDDGARVSPALELQVALLVVMTMWRGAYYALKEGLL